MKRKTRRATSISIKSESVKGPPASSYTPYDARKGHGYGTTNPRFDISRKAQSTYPYVEKREEDDEDIEIIDDAFGGDQGVMDRFVRMINKNFVKTDPSNRADRASFVSNQPKIRLPESSVGVRANSISPIPHKTLYGGFDGPAVGGSSANIAFNPGTYKRTGTQYGTSRAPLYLGDPDEDLDDDISAYTLEDILHPDVKAVARSRARIKKKSG